MMHIHEHYVGQPQPPAVVPPAVAPPGAQLPSTTQVVSGVQQLTKDVADFTMVTLASMWFVVPQGAIQTPDLQTYYALTADRFIELSGGAPTANDTLGPGLIIETGGIGALDPNSPRMIISLEDYARWAEQGVADQMQVLVARTREIAAGIAEPGSQYAVIAPLEGAGAGAGAGVTPRRRSAVPIVVGGAILAAIAYAAFG